MDKSPARYLRPSTVADAIETARTQNGSFRFIAGATDVQLHMQQGLLREQAIIDISAVPELRVFTANESGVILGSLVTLDQLSSSDFIERRYPLIRLAARSVATPVIRKSATIGGNLLVSNRCTFYNQTQFWRDSVGSCLKDTGDSCLVTGLRNGKCFARNVSDTAPALIALNAQVVFRDSREEVKLPLEKIYAQDGLCPIGEILPDGILLRLEIPLPADKWFFRKLRHRKSLDFTSLTVAGTRDGENRVRICLNGIAMAPVLISGVSSELTLSEVLSQARLKSRIVDNDVLPLDYRKKMLHVYLEELWTALDLA